MAVLADIVGELLGNSGAVYGLSGFRNPPAEAAI